MYRPRKIVCASVTQPASCSPLHAALLNAELGTVDLSQHLGDGSGISPYLSTVQ